MRISSSMMFNKGVTAIQQQTADLAKLQQQLATGRRVMTPSDDPIAAARALQVAQSKSVTEQFIANGDHAKSALELQEATMAQVTSLIQDVKTLAVQAGNPALSQSDCASLAAECQSKYDQLMGLANSKDSNGQYLFSGYKGSTQPFTVKPDGSMDYAGDAGERMIQISSSRQIAVSCSGAEVFRDIKTGNGAFATGAAVGNTGTGVVSQGVVLDPNKWNDPANNKDFTIKFDVSSSVPPVTTYDIIDNVTGNSLLTGVAATPTGPYPRTYTSGDSISLKTQSPPDTTATPFDFGGELSITGQPATNDTFTVKSSSNQDVCKTMYDLMEAIKSKTSGTTGNTRFTNQLNTALQNLDQVQDNVLTVRAGLGASLKEVDTQRSTNEDLLLQHNTTLSGLQDLDYTKSISDMTFKLSSLDAAQKSFMKTQGLSLFNYIS